VVFAILLNRNVSNQGTDLKELEVPR
jgi:hypothetical protein